jgi:hypothetical protein
MSQDYNDDEETQKTSKKNKVKNSERSKWKRILYVWGLRFEGEFEVVNQKEFIGF